MAEINAWLAPIETWQQLNNIGDEYFYKSALAEAELAYIRGCDHIQTQLGHQWDTGCVVEAVITSYHNLAECLKCQGRYLTAMEVLLKAHQLMSDGLREKNQPPQKHTAYIEGRRKTLIELKYFQWIMRMSRDANLSDTGIHPDLISKDSKKAKNTLSIKPKRYISVTLLSITAL